MKKQIKLGIFFLATIIVFIGAVLIFGKIKLSSKGYKFYVDYNFTGDLRSNAKVCYRGGGIEIGYVDAISINPDGSIRTDIVITDKNIRLPVSTRFTIQTVGFGLGEKYILVTPPLGDTTGEAEIKTGDVMRGFDPMSIESAIGSLSDITKDIKITDINKFIEDLMNTVHTLNLILEENRSAINSSVLQIDATAKNLNKITSDLANGKGNVGKIMKDETMYANLQDIIANLKVVSEKVKDKPSILIFPEKEKKK